MKRKNSSGKFLKIFFVAFVLVGAAVFASVSLIPSAKISDNEKSPEFAKAPGSIAGTMVLTDVQRDSTGGYERKLYSWNLGHGLAYANNTDWRDSLSFALPGTSCDIAISYCGFGQSVGPRSKIFLDPGTSSEKIGRNCQYMEYWKCGSERFTGVSGGLHTVAIGTWSTVYCAKDYDLSKRGDDNYCPQYDCGSGIYGNDPSTNYYSKTYPRYYGYANNYPVGLTYMSVSYSCA